MLLALGLAGGSVRAAAPGPNPGPISPCIPVPQPIGHPPPKAGDIDVWFGCLGLSVYSAPTLDVQIRALAIQPGDKIVAVGETYDLAMNNHDVWVARFGSDGKLDPTFATAGVFKYDFTKPLGGAESVEAVLVQPDGRIVLGGGYWREDNLKRSGFLIRLLTDGALDPSFGAGGIALASSFSFVRALRVLASGALVAAGDKCTGGDITCLAAIGRFSGTDGSADTSFGVAGSATSTLGGVDSTHAYAASAVGNTVTIGGTTHGATAGNDVGLARYASALDPSFGVGGVKTFNDASTEAVRAMVPHGTGLLLAEDPIVGSAPQFVVARIGPSGAPDASFGVGGRLVDPFSGNGGGASALALTGNGKIVAVGAARDALQRSRMAIARITAAGQLDPTFSTDGNVMTSVAGDEAFATSVAIQSTGRIVVGGWARNAANRRRAVLLGIRDN
jgi:uncharacterized delta-60 repeat protein